MAVDTRVLYVDDDPDFLDLVASYLDAESLTILTATSPTDALEDLDPSVECVVADYQMPEMDGLEFLHEVREQRPELPFILYTGRGSEEIASEAISAGVDEYLQKGSLDSFELLEHRISTLVEKYRIEREIAQVQRRFRYLVEESTDVIMIVAPDGTIRYTSPPAEAVLGRRPKELNGTSGFTPVHPEDVPEVKATFEALAANPGARRSAEFRYAHGSGGYIWVEARGRNLCHIDAIDGIVVYTRALNDKPTPEESAEQVQ